MPRIDSEQAVALAETSRLRSAERADLLRRMVVYLVEPTRTSDVARRFGMKPARALDVLRELEAAGLVRCRMGERKQFFFVQTGRAAMLEHVPGGM